MNIPDIAVAGSIATLYPFFFGKVCDVVMDKKGNENEHNEEELKRIRIYKFTLLIIAGIVAILLSYFIRNNAIMLGLALAGIFTIIMAVCGYWHDMDEKFRLTLVGGALVILFCSPFFVSKFLHKLTK